MEQGKEYNMSATIIEPSAKVSNVYRTNFILGAMKSIYKIYCGGNSAKVLRCNNLSKVSHEPDEVAANTAAGDCAVKEAVVSHSSDLMEGSFPATNYNISIVSLYAGFGIKLNNISVCMERGSHMIYNMTTRSRVVIAPARESRIFITVRKSSDIASGVDNLLAPEENVVCVAQNNRVERIPMGASKKYYIDCGEKNMSRAISIANTEHQHDKDGKVKIVYITHESGKPPIVFCEEIFEYYEVNKLPASHTFQFARPQTRPPFLMKIEFDK